jgi:hypothetical protein
MKNNKLDFKYNIGDTVLVKLTLADEVGEIVERKKRSDNVITYRIKFDGDGNPLTFYECNIIYLFNK